MPFGNLFLSGDEENSNRLLPLAEQFYAQVEARRASLGLDYIEDFLQASIGTVRVRITPFSKFIAIEGDPQVRIPSEDERPEEAEVLFYHLSLPWKPEGLILSPVSATAPYGKTTPDRSDTETGERTGHVENTTSINQHNQILINKYENNKYLDDLNFIETIPDELASIEPRKDWRNNDSYDLDDEGNVQEWTKQRDIYYSTAPRWGQPHSFADDLEGKDNADPETFFDLSKDSIPELTGGLFATTRNTYNSDDFVVEFPAVTRQVLSPDLFNEPETDTWYVHRPQEQLYDSLIKEGIFQRTNELRREAGVGDLVRSYRGTGDYGDVGCYVQGLLNPPKYFGHSHYDWAPGLRTAGGRSIMFVGQQWGIYYADNPMENAIFLPYSDLNLDLTQSPVDIGFNDVAQIWRDSPGHYAAMISAAWDSAGYQSQADVEGRRYWLFRGMGENPAAPNANGVFALSFAKQTAMNIGVSQGSGFIEKFFDVNAGGLNPFWNETAFNKPEGVDQPYPNTTIWAQNFEQRVDWLPIPYETQSTFAGGIGYHGGSCRAGNNRKIFTRWFSFNSRIYEMPYNNAAVPAYVDNLGDPFGTKSGDPFLTILGAHPYLRNGVLWLRVAYVDSDLVPAYWDAQDNGRIFPENGSFYTVKITTFPAGLAESHDLPWNGDTADTAQTLGVEWPIEDEYTFSIADGWFPQEPNTAHFTSDGNRLCFTAYEGDTFEGGQQWSPRFASIYFNPNQIGEINASYPNYEFGETVADITGSVQVPIPRTIEWDYKLGWIFSEPQPRVVSNITSRSDNIGETVEPEPGRVLLTQVNTYIESINGRYLIYPHYGPDDSLQHYQIAIAFYSYHKQFAQFTVQHLGSGLVPGDHDIFAFNQIKLIFPSGRELVLHERNTSAPQLPKPEYTHEIPFSIPITEVIDGQIVIVGYNTGTNSVGGYVGPQGSGETYTPTPHDPFTPSPSSPFSGNFTRTFLYFDIESGRHAYQENSPVWYGRWRYPNEYAPDPKPILYPTPSEVNGWCVVVQDVRIYEDWNDGTDKTLLYERLHTPPVDDVWVHGDYWGYSIGSTEDYDSYYSQAVENINNLSGIAGWPFFATTVGINSYLQSNFYTSFQFSAGDVFDSQGYLSFAQWNAGLNDPFYGGNLQFVANAHQALIPRVNFANPAYAVNPVIDPGATTGFTKRYWLESRVWYSHTVGHNLVSMHTNPPFELFLDSGATEGFFDPVLLTLRDVVSNQGKGSVAGVGSWLGMFSPSFLLGTKYDDVKYNMATYKGLKISRLRLAHLFGNGGWSLSRSYIPGATAANPQSLSELFVLLGEDSDEIIITANFDLDGFADIGEVTDVFPFGVLL